ncbi:MAG: IS1595 family transposase [Saprospiraceae bacterium]|nr:IS1595 family transposase [Candidatus Brachybacter algidus]
METKFKSLSVFAFQTKFPSEQSCYKYLSELKWSAGYQCPKCDNLKYCKGINEFDRQCTKCSHLESPTAGTLFHKMKFSILKAFWIIYYISTNKKGIASTELSRKLQLRQKTCWLFKQKAMQAMESSDRHPLEGNVEICKFTIGSKKRIGKNKAKETSRLIVIGIEKKAKGVSRIYAREIPRISNSAIKNFEEDKISNDCFSIRMKTNNNGKFDLVTRVVDGLKSWLKGIHHHVSLLQNYLNEYCYRYNRHLMKEEIFDDLLVRMVKHEPRTYSYIVNYVPNS